MFKSINISNKDIFFADVVIIGSGAGASVVANEALENGHSVLMVEQGKYYKENEVSTVDKFFHKMWRGSGLTAGLGKPPIAYAEGICLGGTTEINSAIYQIPYEQTINSWVKDFNLGDDWKYEKLLPYYKEIFKKMKVSETHPYFEDTKVLFKGGKKLGYKVENLPRAMDVKSKNKSRTYACPTKGKQTMTRTLLKNAYKGGADILMECWVKKIHFSGKKATKLSCLVNNKKITLSFNKLFICAGAIQTPALLQRSGIRKNVGNTLQFHPTIKVVGRFKQDVQTGESIVPTAAVTEFLPDIRIGGSVFDQGFFAMGIANNYDNAKILLENPKKIGSYYSMIKPNGMGKIISMPFIKEPFVKYNLTDDDFANIQKAVEYTAEVMFAGGANLIFPDLANHKGWENIEQAKTELLEPINRKNFNAMSIHLMSSCRPSGNKNNSVTDPCGKLWNYDNVYIADASQIPTALGVNPQASVMVIAKKYCDLIFKG